MYFLPASFTNHLVGFSPHTRSTATFRPILILIGELSWEKTDPVRGLKHLSAMLFHLVD